MVKKDSSRLAEELAEAKKGSSGGGLPHEQPAPSPSSSSLRTQAKKGSSNGGLPHELAEEAADSLSWRQQPRGKAAALTPSPMGGARPQAST
jgi:hypothetical protein